MAYRLQINQVSKSYSNSSRKALDNVSLNISNGLFGLLGPNGAGKSSLMRTLATLQRPDSGQVFFSGSDIHLNPQELRSQLGYLPQDFGVYPRVSAIDLLDHLALLKGLLNKRERRQQVMALLQQTNLYEYRNQAVSTFSGGMRQRFGIAQALLGNPQLIIVDEPTAGLDPQERNRFHDLLSEIGEQVVVILSTHIVEDVKDLCPEMAIMAQGKVILQGKPAVLTETLKGQVWRKTVSREVAKVYQSSLNIISSKSLMGNTQLHVWAESCPDTGFEAFNPGMEELYFSTLFGAQC
ncbi:ABC transporter ATP-binding protein [Pedobacter caeni]|uniref:ABC-type multidrug transport system, ATPase component n=1 Tax=Pedobacter caeni TaxID=288992 RepID=A0A1M4UNU0_9SPHI|nr:ABC transporter ATP-binding protein [Pedobacter caeni]SHE58431.1 ABC-type multidrug transport system, ATPase component [Pedobacter caeni]